MTTCSLAAVAPSFVRLISDCNAGNFSYKADAILLMQSFHKILEPSRYTMTDGDSPRPERRRTDTARVEAMAAIVDTALPSPFESYRFRPYRFRPTDATGLFSAR